MDNWIWAKDKVMSLKSTCCDNDVPQSVSVKRRPAGRRKTIPTIVQDFPIDRFANFVTPITSGIFLQDGPLDESKRFDCHFDPLIDGMESGKRDLVPILSELENRFF